MNRTDGVPLSNVRRNSKYCETEMRCVLTSELPTRDVLDEMTKAIRSDDILTGYQWC
jgi:hypothetical protein